MVAKCADIRAVLDGDERAFCVMTRQTKNNQLMPKFAKEEPEPAHQTKPETGQKGGIH